MSESQKMDNIILVTGARRSGISIIGGVISLCGAQTGWGELKFYDGRGSFENMEINESMIKPFLRGIKANPSGQNPLPNLDRCKKIAERLHPVWRRRIEKILLTQKRKEESAPGIIVSPNLCLIWPIWAKAFPTAHWVIVRRRDEDIIRSCMQTGYMTAYKNRKGWEQWIETYKQRFMEINSAGLTIYQVWPQKILQGQLSEMRALISNLGLQWNSEAVEDFIAPILWKNGVFELQKC